jgi:hypothetical protein
VGRCREHSQPRCRAELRKPLLHQAQLGGLRLPEPGLQHRLQPRRRAALCRSGQPLPRRVHHSRQRVQPARICVPPSRDREL